VDDDLLAALGALELPAAFALLGAVDANLAVAVAAAAGTPIRLATKSLRCPAPIERALADPGVVGLMCAAAHEAAWWAERRPDADVLIAYPSVEPAALRRCLAAVAGGAVVRFMVDGPAHVALLDRLAGEVGVVAEVCLDLDLSIDVGPLRFGVQRSPVRSAADAVALAAVVDRHPAVRLVGLMGYEAQLAGLADRPARPATADPAGAVRATAIRALKRRTAGPARARRAEAVAALRRAGVDLLVVDGGGSGSVPSTAAEPDVTEVAVGSALLCPTLFDGYDDVRYEPASGFALRVVRVPGEGIVTCYGGGWVASGPAGRDRLPAVWHPAGARLLPTEGAGEVQTPVALPDGVAPDVGDVVVLRHAKAGELCDRVDRLHLVHADGQVEAVPTYRGLGLVLS
jgi:D-serine deaminase-like pyridoxal phosphate-dependent protein